MESSTIVEYLEDTYPETKESFLVQYTLYQSFGSGLIVSGFIFIDSDRKHHFQRKKPPKILLLPLFYTSGSGSGTGSKDQNECGSDRIRIHTLPYIEIDMMGCTHLNCNLKLKIENKEQNGGTLI